MLVEGGFGARRALQRRPGVDPTPLLPPIIRADQKYHPSPGIIGETCVRVPYMPSIWFKVFIGVLVAVEWLLMVSAVMFVVWALVSWTTTGSCTGIACW